MPAERLAVEIFQKILVLNTQIPSARIHTQTAGSWQLGKKFMSAALQF
jgi:hypothetical protein